MDSGVAAEVAVAVGLGVGVGVSVGAGVGDVPVAVGAGSDVGIGVFVSTGSGGFVVVRGDESVDSVAGLVAGVASDWPPAAAVSVGAASGVGVASAQAARVRRTMKTVGNSSFAMPGVSPFVQMASSGSTARACLLCRSLSLGSLSRKPFQ